MRRFLQLVIYLLFSGFLKAQPEGIYTRQFRLSIDEDFINIRGEGTDEAYTGGLHLDYAYTARKVRFFLGRWLPKAGEAAINTYEIGLSQMMFTPKDLSVTYPLRGDYPYAGTLLARYSLYSINPEKQYSVQSAVSLGVMGPVSQAEDIQLFLHNAIGDETPMGWKNQLPNDILLNYQLTGERRILHGETKFELIGGGQVEGGSMINSASVYLLLRTGRMKPYFTGLLSRNGTPRINGMPRRNRFQVYARVKPAVRFVAYDALLQGGVLLKQGKAISPQIHHFIGSLDYGLTVAYKNFSVSFTQTSMSPFVEGAGAHETGNITLYFNW